MSTKTTFKRVALAAAASLGFGLFSAVPSQATALEPITLVATNGTATYGTSDSTTAGSFTLTYSGTGNDSAVVTFISTAVPSGGTAPYITGYYRTTDTLAASTYATGADTTGTTGAAVVRAFRTNLIAGTATYPANTRSAATKTAISASDSMLIQGITNTQTKVKFSINMETTTGTRVAGTYSYTVVANVYNESGTLNSVKSANIDFTIALVASNSKTVNAGQSSAWFSADGSLTSDEVVLAEGTAAADPIGVMNVKLRNASGNTTALESVTVTTSLGLVGTPGGTFGRSVVLAYASGIDSLTVYVRPDGSTGTGTISVSTPSASFANKTVIFYAAAPTKLVATSLISVLGSGSNAAAISVKATDASGNPWAGTLYTYATDATISSNSATSCSYDTTDSRHECTVTGLTNGTTVITVRDAATVAASTVSATVSVTVNINPAATVKLAWDKASYAPGEKATLIVSAYDSAGKMVRGQTLTNIFATGGISLNIAGGSGSDTTSAVTFATASLASASSAYTNTDPIKTYTIYMPYSGGTVTASATGGTALPQAGQVAVSATATVTDAGSQALAAVTALASQVSAFITKINAQITTLTDLVMKIQKKVKA